MRLAFFMAMRLAFNRQRNHSTLIIRLAIAAVALSIAVMIVGTGITRGYQSIISKKFFACWGAMHLSTFQPDPTALLSSETLRPDSSLIQQLKETPNVRSVKAFTLQTALIKTPDDLEGIVLKGYSQQTLNESDNQFLTAGRNIELPDSGYSQEIILSVYTARALKLKLQDEFILYFITEEAEHPKARKMKLVGLFETGLEEFDKNFAQVDNRLISHIHQSPEAFIHGYEIHTKNAAVNAQTYQLIQSKVTSDSLHLYSLEERFAPVFSWLNMMKMNERIILIIMMLVAMVNMLAVILILILERTRMIGLLKALGMPGKQLRLIFLITSLLILLTGMLSGTLIGITLCWIQQKTGFIQLDKAIYYVSSVPVQLDASILLYVNLLTLLCGVLILWLPAYIIKSFTPLKALRFD